MQPRSLAHAAPNGHAGAEADAKGELVRVLAAVLERLVHEIAKLFSRIEQVVAELPDGQIAAGPAVRRVTVGRNRRGGP